MFLPRLALRQGVRQARTLVSTVQLAARPVPNRAPLTAQTTAAELTQYLTPKKDAPKTITQAPGAADGGNEIGLVEALFDARVHLGHKPGLWNPQNEWFIEGTRGGVHMINLDITAAYTRKSLDVIRSIVEVDGTILFVNTREQDEVATRRAATACGEYFVTKKWMGGTLTNSSVTVGHTKLPDLIIMIGIPVLPVAIKEAAQMVIPTIGVVDTNCDGSGLTIQVPGNDDSPEAVALFLHLFAGEIIKTKRKMFEADRTRKGGSTSEEGLNFAQADGLNF